jgi:hypothetical protein
MYHLNFQIPQIGVRQYREGVDWFWPVNGLQEVNHTSFQ